MGIPQSIAGTSTPWHWLESRRVRHALLWTSVALAIAFLLTTSVFGVGRPKGKFFGTHDFTYFYSGGRCFIHGENPYNEATLRARSEGELGSHPYRDESTVRVYGGFAYPPSSAPFFALLSLPDFNTSRLINGAINAICFGWFAWLLWWVARREGVLDRRWGWIVMTACTAFVFASPFSSHAMWNGQTSLLAMTLTFAAWWCWQNDRWVIAGLLLALASFKPPFCAFLVLMLVYNRAWKPLFASIGFGLALMSMAAYQQGPVGMMHNWLGAVKVYANYHTNLPDFLQSFGMRSLLSAAGWKTVPSLALLALVLFGTLLWQSKRFTSFETMCLGLIISLMFINAHNYDLIVLTPILAAVLFRFGTTMPRIALTLFVVAALCFPMRAMKALEGLPEFLIRWREMLLIAATLAWVWWMTKNTPTLPRHSAASTTA